jgi:hypothetical protein
MSHLSNKVQVKAIGKILIRSAWPQLLTVAAFMVGISTGHAKTAVSSTLAWSSVLT